MVRLTSILFATSKNFYTYIGVTQTSATPHNLKLAFYEKSKILHPDNKKSGSQEEFVDLQNIYNILKDGREKKEYDVFLHFVEHKHGPKLRDISQHLKMYENRHTNMAFKTRTMKKNVDYGESPEDFSTHRSTDNYPVSSDRQVSFTINTLTIFTFIAFIIFYNKHLKRKFQALHVPYQVPIRQQLIEDVIRKK